MSQGRAGSLAFEVDDLEAMYRQLQARGGNPGEFGIEEWGGNQHHTCFLRKQENATASTSRCQRSDVDLQSRSNASLGTTTMELVMSSRRTLTTSPGARSHKYLWLLVVLVGSGCVRTEEPAPPHLTREACGKREMFLHTDKYPSGKWFPVVTATEAKCLQHLPSTFTPGTVVAVNEDDTVLVYSHVEASKRSQWESSGEAGYPRRRAD